MQKRSIIAVLFWLCGCLTLRAVDELSIARSALADGLPDLARAAAEKALVVVTNATDLTTARYLLLDALIDAADAEGALARLDSWADAQGEGFRYRRALALAECNRMTEARSMLSSTFVDKEYEERAKRLRKYLKARERLAAGDREGALKFLADAKDAESLFYASELMPDNEESRKLRASLMVSSVRPEVRRRVSVRLGLDELRHESSFSNGVARIRKALAGEPDAPEALPASLEIARRLLERGESVAAEAEYARILSTYPESSLDAVVLERRGWALLGAGRRTEAIGAFARAAQVATNASIKARCSFKRADALFADGRYPDAAQAFAELAVSGGSVYADRAAFSAADAYERAGSTNEALVLYKELAARDGPYHIRAELRLAVALAAAGRTDAAVKAYTEVYTNASSTVEDRVSALWGRGRAWYRAYGFREAAIDFEQAARLDPKHREEATFLGILCLYGENRDEKAKKSAELLLAETTNATLRDDLMTWLARFDFNRGAWDEAQRRFDACALAHSNGVEAARIRLWCARTALERSEYRQAIQRASEAVSIAGSSAPEIVAEALLVQGESLMELARFDDAVKVFSQLILSSPAEEVARRAGIRRADALFALGADNAACYKQSILAYRELDTSGRLQPGERLLVSFQIGRALEKMRRFDDAMKQLYAHVVLAYEQERGKGVWFDDAAKALYARAGFMLADLYEARGNTRAAAGVLRHVAESDVSAADEARRRLKLLESGRGGR